MFDIFHYLLYTYVEDCFMKINKITKLTNDKYLNMFEVSFANGMNWVFASRRSEKELSVNNKKDKVDAVVIMPLVVDSDGDKCVVVTKEFRYPRNDYIYSFPAGLVEEGEELEKSALRELKEEIGAEGNIKLTMLCDKSYSSEGLTDESCVLFLAEIEKLGEQELEETEDISFQFVKMKNLKDFIKGKKTSIKLSLFAALIK